MYYSTYRHSCWSLWCTVYAMNLDHVLEQCDGEDATHISCLEYISEVPVLDVCQIQVFL